MLPPAVIMSKNAAQALQTNAKAMASLSRAEASLGRGEETLLVVLSGWVNHRRGRLDVVDWVASLMFSGFDTAKKVKEHKSRAGNNKRSVLFKVLP